MARAVSDAAKAKKADEILNSAHDLLEYREYEKVKMSEISNSMGISKGLVFLYFKSKKVLFLNLLMREYNERMIKLNSLAKAAQVASFDDFKALIAREMAQTIDKNEVFIRLLEVRASVLEKNTDKNMIEEFSKEQSDDAREVARTIRKTWGFFEVSEILEILYAQEAIIVGYCGLSSDRRRAGMSDGEEKPSYSQTAFRESALNAMERYMNGFYLQKQINAMSKANE